MPLSEIKSVVFQAELLQENGLPLGAVNTTVQYFDLKSNAWSILATGLMSDTKGQLVVAVSFNLAVKENAAFFEALRSGFALQMRLITTESIKLVIKEIVALSGKTNYVDRTSSYTVVFGKCYRLSPLARTLVGVNKADNTQLAFVPFLDTSVYAEIEKLRSELAQKNAQYNKLNDAFASMQQKFEATSSDYQKLQVQFTDLSGQYKELAAANSKLEQRIKQVENENNQLKADIAQWRKLAEESKLCQQKLTAAMAELDHSATTLQRAIDLNQKYEQSLKAQSAELSKLNVEYTELEQVIVEHNETIAQLQDKLVKTNTQLEEVSKQNVVLLDKIEVLNKQLDSAQSDNQTGYKPVAQPVNKVYSSIINEFQKTNELTKDSNFKLANISLNIKTFIEHDDDGVRLQLVDAQKLKDINSAALSDFNIEIKDTSSTVSSGTTLNMPDMVGLTESAARRVADTLGLRIKSVYQYVNAKVPVGQCFKQSPAKGSALAANDIITLIFAKQNN